MRADDRAGDVTEDAILGGRLRLTQPAVTYQLRTLERSEAQAIAIIICKGHLPLLARRDLKKLMAVTGADETLLREALDLVAIAAVSVRKRTTGGYALTKLAGQVHRLRVHLMRRPRASGARTAPGWLLRWMRRTTQDGGGRRTVGRWSTTPGAS